VTGLVALPDGRRLQVWQGGPVDGRPVLFLPGCPDSRLVARSGTDAAHRLGVRLVAVNRPGYGRSDPYPSDHLKVADDLVHLADRLGARRFALVGMSVGGPYALACAARHPDRVTAVGVVAAPAMHAAPDAPGHPLVGVPIALVRKDFLEYVRRMAPDDPDDAALARRYLDALDPYDAAVVAALPVPDVANGVREALSRPDGYLRDAAVTFRPWQFRLDEIRCPVRLWYGEYDANVHNGRWLAGRVPGAELTILDGVGHLGALLGHWDEILAATA